MENKNRNNNPNKDVLWSFIIIFLFLIGFISVDIFVFKKDSSDMEKQEEKQEDIIATPDDDEPIKTEEQEVVKLLTTGNLLKTPYVPTEDVYTTNYKKESIKLVLDGEFEYAEFKIDGEVLADGRNFISMNFENVGGVINSVRKEEGLLDSVETKKMGGVFVKGVPIDLTLSLVDKITLSATKKEFEETKIQKKEVILWEKLLQVPPTVMQFIFTPFNENGRYGGSQINSIKFNYLCKKDNICKVSVCPYYKKYTQCLVEKFGYAKAKDWCDRSKLDGCDEL